MFPTQWKMQPQNAGAKCGTPYNIFPRTLQPDALRAPHRAHRVELLVLVHWGAMDLGEVHLDV